MWGWAVMVQRFDWPYDWIKGEIFWRGAVISGYMCDDYWRGFIVASLVVDGCSGWIWVTRARQLVDLA